MGFSADLRRDAAPRIALVAVAALLAGGLAAGPERTAATLTGTATSTSSITAREACLVEQEDHVQAYTSGLLDQAKPALRWSFSDGALPKDAAESASQPEIVTHGLLQCDPANFRASTAKPGSLRLAEGGKTGLAIVSQPLTTSFTLLLWVSPETKSEGELAALSNSTGELALSLSGSTVSLSVPGSDTATTHTLASLAQGKAHLVAATFDRGTLALTVDGSTTKAVQTAWSPEKVQTALTIGARTDHPSASALVDEVTLLTGPASAEWLHALFTSDRWWVRADWKAGQVTAPEAALAVTPATIPAPEPVAEPAPTVDPSSSPTTPATVEPTASPQPTAPATTDPQTTDERRSKSTMSRHKPSR